MRFLLSIGLETFCDAKISGCQRSRLSVFGNLFIITHRHCKDDSCPMALPPVLTPDIPAVSFNDSSCDRQSHAESEHILPVRTVISGAKESFEHFFAQG